VLIITCPCALGLAVPVAQVVASGSLMRAGIMVKDGSALERLASVDRALLDKTGTLTLGKPLPDPASLAALEADEAEIALALASHSRHPLSRALAAALSVPGRTAAPLTAVAERAGEGVFAVWQGLKVSLSRPQGGGASMAVAFAIAGRPVRLISFSDRLRPDSSAALGELRRMGVECSILSGDRIAAVGEVAQATGLTAQAGATPAEKQALVGRLQASGRKVLMVGDGLNDGPALAAADASMAPGSASDVGLQAADLVFVQDSLLALPRAVRAARRTMAVVRQNFGLAIGYNVLAVPLAMAGIVTPLIAALAMSTSSLIVIANSLRLARAAR
jgi:Cu2+-exporting ATPase